MKKINNKIIIAIVAFVFIALLILIYYNYNIAKNNKSSEISAMPESEFTDTDVQVEDPEDEFINIDELETEDVPEESVPENIDTISDKKSNTSNSRFYFKQI